MRKRIRPGRGTLAPVEAKCQPGGATRGSLCYATPAGRDRPLTTMKNPFTATLQGLREMHDPAGAARPLGEDERLDDRVALVTGANRGLGLAVAADLAGRGARVIMACRSGLPDAVDAVRRRSGSTLVETRPVDLADLGSVAGLCAELARNGVKIDVLVLNAGVVPRESRRTAQGLELMFGVNYLANVALVEGLLDAGVLVPGNVSKPRIVFVSSESHRGAGPVDLDSLGRFQTYGAMAGIKVYGYSKLLLTVYAFGLARRLAGTASVHACCPGPINSDIAREAPGWMKPLLRVVMARFFRSPEDAAAPVVLLAGARSLDDRTGTYMHFMTEKAPDPQCLDAALGERLEVASRRILAGLLRNPHRGEP